jgi:Zn-dependent protease
MDFLIDASAWVLPLVLAITLHEAAHGWMAERFGDKTARNLGRVTFNPLKHIDQFGTVLLPGLLFLMKSPILFGYAKPVPVNFDNLTPPRRGMFFVAIAGVMVNFVLAVASALLLHLEAFITPEQAPWLYMNLYRSIMINCVLIVFNMLPILPLDGGRAVDSLLTGPAKRAFGRIEPYGIMIVLSALLLSALMELGQAEAVIGVPSLWLVEQVLHFTGNGQ